MSSSLDSPHFPSLTIGATTISANFPAIITPVTATSTDGAVTAIEELVNREGFTDVDAVEWRIDYILAVTPDADIRSVIPKIRAVLKDTLLIITLRTSAEGGEIQLSDQKYFDHLSPLLDKLRDSIIDIEYERATAIELLKLAHRNGVYAIGSHHNFHATPDTVEISQHLRSIHIQGYDVAKLAVMPHSPVDVTRLLDTTYFSAQRLSIPLITMSMGPLGYASRTSGGAFGSAASFGKMGASSAPGQLPVGMLAEARETIHGNEF